MRIRAIKPGFFRNEVLCELSPWHRLCFEGLWLCADREGRLQDRPKRLKADIFPYDDLDMNALLWDLCRAGFIVRYAVHAQPLIWIPTFLEHQRPRPDEADSVLPPYEPGSDRRNGPDQTTFPVTRPLQAADSKGVAEIVSVTTLRSDGSDTAARIGKGKGDLDLGSGEGIAAPPLPHMAAPCRAQDLVDLWNATTKPPIPRCQELTDDRRKKIRSRLRKRPSLSEWREVFEAIQNSAFCRGENDRKWTADFDWIIRNDTNPVKMLERARTSPQRSVRVNGCFHQPPCGSQTEHTRRALAESEVA